MTQNIQSQTELSEAKRLLLEKLLRGGLSNTARSLPVKEHAQRESTAPLSFGQQQLWLLAQLMLDAPVYTECVTIHLPGPLNVPVFERSFNEILKRHDAWRTSFPLIDGQPIQKIHPYEPISIPLVDLRSLPVEQREAEAVRLATQEIHTPFDLANGPLLRTTLVQLDDLEHRLFLTLHHIIFDGYSLYQILLPELRAVYDAFLLGQSSPLAPLPIQYANFAIRQREWAKGETITKQLAFWQRQLADAPNQLALPTDRPRPPVPTYRGSMRPFALSKTLTDALKALHQEEGVTFYMLLVAAFQLLLARYAGQDDILLGTAISDRKHADVEGLMGFFLNTLVLRTDLSGNPTFRELLQRVREVVLDAHAHQDVPFELLVKELHPERTVGQNPFFQAVISLEPPLYVHASGWTLTQMDVETETAKFDLSLELDDRPEGLIGRFEYNTGLFDTATIERMAGHWQTLLENIVAHPERRINDFSLLTPREWQQIVVEWNDNAKDYPRAASIHRLFEEQAARTPDAIAVMFENEQLTYRELNQAANALAHYLQGRGIGPETVVGICTERSIEMVVALLAILKAGGAYLPLEATYPKERLAFMLHDAQASLLLTLHKFSSTFTGMGTPLLCLDTDRKLFAADNGENIAYDGTGDALAYIIYTSGSTGKPKGVCVTHRNVVRLVKQTNYIRFSEDEVFLQFAPVAFDASTLEIWGSLLNGARLVVFPAHLPSLEELGQVVQRYHVTTLWLTAGLFHQMIEAHPTGLKGVRQLLAGGDVLSVPHVQKALRELPGCTVINGYGPTENTTFTCCYPMTAPEQIGTTVPIGRPVGHTQVYVLDAHLQPVPVGVPGELYAGGDGVARGYLNRPELTAERFIPDPFNPEPGNHLYKTGDLVRYRPDGAIEFLGRIDQQVKIRGFRVELGEIEETIKQYPGVRETVVIAREDTPGDKRLVAYIVTTSASGQSPTIHALRASLQEKLPGYMVPSAFVPLDALPLTSIGKIDRKALPAPTYNAGSSTKAVGDENDEFTAPLMTIHHQLTRIWEELLGVRPIGIRDNFFDLGGHSLLAARLLAEVERISGKKLPMTTFFAGATIEHLANAILGDEETRSRAPAVAIQASGTQPPFFFLHGDWIGGGFYCLELSRSLGNDQPFYVMEPYKFAGLSVPPTLKEVAAAHIASMRAVQPEGPYYFGGFCNGGLIAYEMARQLQAAGQEIALLLLVDPAIPRAHRKVYEYITRYGGKLRLSKAAQVDWFLRYLYVKMPHFRKRFKGSEHLEEIDEIELGREGDIQSSWREKLNVIPPRARVLRQQWSGIYRWVAAGYVPGPYTGKATFLWSSDEYSVFARYKHVAQNADIQVVSGTHMGWKTDNLAILSEKMRGYLNQAHIEKHQKEL